MTYRVVLVLVAACSFTHGQSSFTAGSGDGASARDGSIDAACAFSMQLDTCHLPMGGDLTLSGTNTFDTNTGTLKMGTTPIPVMQMVMATHGTMVDAIVVHDLTMTSSATLRATGDLPFAIVASGSVTLDDSAIIDVSAGGAGARPSCTNGAAAGADEFGGAGGGGGGGFGAVGGDGGTGNSDGTHGPGGMGGAMAATAPLGPLGGCPGAAGGTGSDAGGPGGAGGGAIYIVAKSAITIAANGGINAGGDAGGGGTRTGGNNGDAGGGGGGSGGMILLEAAMLANSGTLAANGGGGGQGSGGGTAGKKGTPGQLSTSAAPGGTGGNSTGTDGAAGGALAATPGQSPTTIDVGGGGGGGGGVGYVWLIAPAKTAGTTSPISI